MGNPRIAANPTPYQVEHCGFDDELMASRQLTRQKAQRIIAPVNPNDQWRTESIYTPEEEDEDDDDFLPSPGLGKRNNSKDPYGALSVLEAHKRLQQQHSTIFPRPGQQKYLPVEDRE